MTDGRNEDVTELNVRELALRYDRDDVLRHMLRTTPPIYFIGELPNVDELDRLDEGDAAGRATESERPHPAADTQGRG